MKNTLNVTVHLVDDEVAPFQLEIEDGDVIILDYVSDMKEANEALLLAINAMKESYDTGEIPDILQSDNFEFEYRYDIHALLRRYSGILTQSTMSRISKMNKSLLSQYMNEKEPRVLSKKQAKRIEESLHEFGKELLLVKLSA